MTWRAGQTMGMPRSRPPGFLSLVRNRLVASLSPTWWMPLQKRERWKLEMTLEEAGLGVDP